MKYYLVVLHGTYSIFKCEVKTYTWHYWTDHGWEPMMIPGLGSEVFNADSATEFNEEAKKMELELPDITE